jgi:hypothetical protein
MKLSITSSIACLEADPDKCEDETIAEAGEQDVLFGRGGKSYSHPGNRLFRRLIFHYKDLYESMKKAHHRQFLALSIVQAIRLSGAKFLRKENSISSPSGEGSAVPNESHNEMQRDRNIVSPCNSSQASKNVESALPPVPSLMPSIPASYSEDLDDIDHIELETIHALLRSLGGNRQQQQQQESMCHSTPTRPSLQRCSWSRWSHTGQPLQIQLQKTNRTNNRQAVIIGDWLSAEATADNELPPAALKPSNQVFHQDIISSTRCSISSVSMLEAGLFSVDFDVDDFDVDIEMFSA